MCGIFALLDALGDKTKFQLLAHKLMGRIRHRGPDDSGLNYFQNGNLHNFLGHMRLSIVDPEGGHQPQFGETGQVASICNGEIYNHLECRKLLKGKHTFNHHNDCLVIPHMYEEMSVPELANHLKGMFGILIFDNLKKKYVVIRDHAGIIPIYMGIGYEGEFYVCNELKVFHDYAKSIEILLPGHYYDSEIKKQLPWYMPLYYNMDLIPTEQVDYLKLNKIFTEAVISHLMVDVPFGLLISGGLDSSLVASIVVRHYQNLVKEGVLSTMPVIHSFSVGLSTSPDLIAAREVAKFLGTTNHEIIYEIEEGILHVPDVIYYIETFNPTTIRASTPMYLMLRYIKSLGIKMVLSGEGADEILGGYLYFHKAPSPKEFHQETIRKIQDLYKYDLLRGNKSSLAWGVELRVPFLYKDFIEHCMNIDPYYKMVNSNEKKIEKYILRKAFDDKDQPYLPDSVLWRQKEQFSDGVGYGWIDGLKKFAEDYISDEDFSKAELRFPLKTPPTKEAYLYRMWFEEHFPSMSAVNTVPQNKSIACSTEKALEWDIAFKHNADESARSVVGVHVSSNNNIDSSIENEYFKK